MIICLPDHINCMNPTSKGLQDIGNTKMITKNTCQLTSNLIYFYPLTINTHCIIEKKTLKFVFDFLSW